MTKVGVTTVQSDWVVHERSVWVGMAEVEVKDSATKSLILYEDVCIIISTDNFVRKYLVALSPASQNASKDLGHGGVTMTDTSSVHKKK